MNLRNLATLACAAVLSISLAGCCCLPNGGSGAGGDGGPKFGGPTLRAGFVRVSKNASTKAVAYYSTDNVDDSKEYWIVPGGKMPVYATVGDTLHFEFLNEGTVGSPEEMCVWYQTHYMNYVPPGEDPADHEFKNPEVYTVTTAKSPPHVCPN